MKSAKQALYLSKVEGVYVVKQHWRTEAFLGQLRGSEGRDERIFISELCISRLRFILRNSARLALSAANLIQAALNHFM
jgi:hypothetical protein